VDNATQKYYLADRTNNAIDVVDAATDTFLGFIGKGQYTGSKPCPGRPKDLRHCSGPNGVTTDDQGHVWAGDGAGDVIEADAAKPGAPIIRKIATGGKFRVDEVAYDPVDRILIASSDGDSPVFLTFISVTDGKVLGHYRYPKDQDGLEQPAWVRATGSFYQNVPGPKNRIDVFDPHKLPNPLKSFLVECSGGLLGLTLSGLVAGPDARLMTVCGTVGGKSLDARTGRVLKTIPQVGDADEVWYDPGSNRYYFAHSAAGAAEATAARSGAIGIVDAATDAFVTDIPIEGAGVHSVAVNARNAHIFVPVNGRGILVITLGR
jgi:DNA-binding beta-propeller fold protein YncE